MKRRYYDGQSGRFLSFIDNEVSFSDLRDSINKSTMNRAAIVFLTESSISPYLKLLERFGNRIDVCFTGSVTNEMILEAVYLFSINRITRIATSIDGLYTALPFDNIIIGSEMWEYYGEADAIRGLDADTLTCSSVQGVMEQVAETVDWIFSFSPENELDAILLTDLWLQYNVQYIARRESYANGGKYVCEQMSRDSVVEDVFLNHFGRCEDIAFTAAMILNHPKLGIHCRQVSSETKNHSWNIVRCYDLEYYADFTRNITRNPSQIPGSLKATAYYSKYTLFGFLDAQDEYVFCQEYNTERVCARAFDSICKQNALSRLKSKGASTKWDVPLVMNSCFIREGGET